MTKKTYILYAISLILLAFVGSGITFVLVFIEAYEVSATAFFFKSVITALFIVSPSLLTFLFTHDVMIRCNKKPIVLLFWEIAILFMYFIASCLLINGSSPLFSLYICLIFVFPTIPVCTISALIYSSKINTIIKSSSEITQVIIKNVLLFVIPSSLIVACDWFSVKIYGGKISYFAGEVLSLIFLSIAFLSIFCVFENPQKFKRIILSLMLNIIFSIILGFILHKENSIYSLLALLPPIAFAITSLITLAVRREKKAEDSSAA